jgi:hypothetical protein
LDIAELLNTSSWRKEGELGHVPRPRCGLQAAPFESLAQCAQAHCFSAPNKKAREEA